MIELTPPSPEEERNMDRVTVLAEFNGTTYRLGSMLFDPEEASMPGIMLGLSEYLITIANHMRFQTEAGQELKAMLAEIEGTE